MKQQSRKSAQVYAAIAAIAGWFALIVQLYLIIINRSGTVSNTIIQYFSYFTILTNILVACYFTIFLLKPSSRLGLFFLKSGPTTAIAVYILVVGITYNVILRNLWNPQGWQKMADELLHVINPMLFILYWFVFAQTERLQWKAILSWMIYPLIYFVYILCRGALSGSYPYPFVDVKLLGYTKVFINSLVIMISFVLLSFLFVALSRYQEKKPQKRLES